jgi:hypothetical protein
MPDLEEPKPSIPVEKVKEEVAQSSSDTDKGDDFF